MSEPPDPEDQLLRTALLELVDIGMQLARDLPAQSKDRTQKPQDIVAQYDTLARGIRRTVLLTRHLKRPLAAERAPKVDRVAARKRIFRGVEDVIARRTTGDEAAALRTELNERLDTLDTEDDIQNQPVPDIVADIVRDFGLGGAAYQRRTPPIIRDLCARAAAPPSPAARPAPTRPPPDPHQRKPSATSLLDHLVRSG